MKPRVFCLGDIHGAHKALVQVLKRCEFDYENDLLITIGDIVDGWGDSYMCVEELLKIPNRIDIMGNHDNWFRVFLERGVHEVAWTQGGLSTAKSYARAADVDLMVQKINTYDGAGFTLNLNSGDVPQSHHIFFRRQHHYYKDEMNNLFIHGGFNNMTPLNETLAYNMMWDRHLWNKHLKIMGTSMKIIYKEDFNQIFIGHTTTTQIGTDNPVHIDKLWNVDTGAGGGGKLTIMNVETNEYFQSDNVPSLYPDDEHNINN
jgi:serine/threonine protein phosphatase 1